MTPQLKSLKPTVSLPDGKPFKTWQPSLQFSRTYFVDARARNASDHNPGTQDRPFRTINRAAQVLKPGERVVVAAGVYREAVRPARGGSAPDRMISYQAAPGARVVIKGSRVLGGDRWRRRGNAWEAGLRFADFDGPNPFAIPNISDSQFDLMPWAQEWRGKLPYTLSAGLVFQNGRRLTQVASRQELRRAPGAYWVGDGGALLCVHPLGGADPGRAVMEITTQRDLFAPVVHGLGYVHVAGLTLEHAGNAFPFPQFGALSTARGHHWLIEHNTVRQANGVGIDIALQHFILAEPETPPGWHIVRRNRVEDCGVCGLAGLTCRDTLIEDNEFRGNAFHDVEIYFETAAIKTHNNIGTVIRRNRIRDTRHGSGIWMDFGNRNSRCTGNVISGGQTMFGGIFVEASRFANLVDGNVVWGVNGSGIYEHDCSNQVFRDNVIGRCKGAALRLRGKCTDRKIDNLPIVGGNHTVTGNVSFRNKEFLESPDKHRRVAGNVRDGVTARFDACAGRVTWRGRGEKRSRTVAPLARG